MRSEGSLFSQKVCYLLIYEVCGDVWGYRKDEGYGVGGGYL